MRRRRPGHGHDRRAPQLVLSETEARVAAVLALLRGEDAARLAADLGVPQSVLEAWRDAFVDAGRGRLAGGLGPMPPEARERFLALVAHEFRTPVAIIAGWADTLAQGDLDGETLRLGVRTLQRQVRHLELLLRDAMDAAAVAVGELRLQVTATELRSLVACVLDAIDRPGLRLAAGSDVEAVVDRNRVEQAVAAFAQVALRHAGSDAVVVTVARSDGWAEIEIESCGAPLSFQDAQTLFEPFARGDSSRSAGLGLYLARAYVVAHGGEVGVRASGRSTRFRLRLPVGGPPG